MWGMMLLGILLLASVALAKDNHTILIDLGNYTYINEAEGPNNWTVRSHIRYLSDEAMRPVVRHKRNLQVPKKNDNIPPVVNPDYDDPVPKFNCFLAQRINNLELVRCACVLIRDNAVVTAGSCLKYDGNAYSPDDIYIRMVTFIHMDNALEHYDVKVLDLKVHPDSGTEPTSDLGLIYLHSKIARDEFMVPAKLPKQSDVLAHPGINEYWDLSNLRPNHYAVDFRGSMWLMKSTFVKSHLCKEVLEPKFKLNRATCASYYHEESSTCQADYGTGVSYDGILIGVLVLKEYCGSPRSAALFVNIALHKKWILNTISGFESRHNQDRDSCSDCAEYKKF